MICLKKNGTWTLSTCKLSPLSEPQMISTTYLPSDEETHAEHHTPTRAPIVFRPDIDSELADDRPIFLALLFDGDVGVVGCKGSSVSGGRG